MLFIIYIIDQNNRVSETDILQKDAEEMETRLRMLQERMKQQQVESADAMSKTGGSAKWKSARVEKGSIRAYGKEVHDKAKKKSAEEGGGDPMLRTNINRRPSQPKGASADGDFTTRGTLITLK
jgi:hypothetical protein